MKLDIDYVFECLDEERYNELIKYLDKVKEHDETQFSNQLVKVIVAMNRINTLNNYKYPEVEYKNSRRRSVSRFYEALRNKDFEEARFLVDDAIEYLDSQYRDYEELEIYKDILEYAIDVQKRAIKRSEDLARITELTEELEKYTKKNKTVKEEDFGWLLDTMEEIIDLSEANNRHSSKIRYATDIIYTILDFNDGVYRDRNYFGYVSEYPEETNAIDVVYKNLENGQYPSAYSTLKRYSMCAHREIKWMYKLYLMLLRYLKDILNAYEPVVITSDEETICNENIDFDRMFEDALEDDNIKDPELLANLVLVRTLNK